MCLVSGVFGAARFSKELKSSNILVLLAPGASVLNYSKAEFERLAEYDTVAINFFSLHDFNADYYLIEPHDQSLDFFSSKPSSKLNGKVLYKGYSSPSSFCWMVKNLFTAKTKGIDVLLMKESGCYFSEDCHGLDQHFDDCFNLGGNSLIYMIMLAIKARYQSVILCGFDMDGNYFYNDPRAAVAAVLKAKSRGLDAVQHNMVGNFELQNQVKNKIIELVKIEKQKTPDFTVSVFKGHGVLAEVLDRSELS
ncbi:hypothetical protein N9E28_00980 [Alphaproteobacteria bacterium]|nr:hypothetical protein [Alphaproteobacteria bacterium]